MKTIAAIVAGAAAFFVLLGLAPLLGWLLGFSEYPLLVMVVPVAVVAVVAFWQMGRAILGDD